jgi:hypothetical protein
MSRIFRVGTGLTFTTAFPDCVGMKLTLILLATVSFLAVGCVTGSHILTGSSRPALLPDSVKVYTAVPTHAEVIGIVSSQSRGRPGQGSTDACIRELKIQAAKIGANGLVLGAIGTSSGQTTTVMMGTTPMMMTSPDQTQLTGTAIFVP